MGPVHCLVFTADGEGTSHPTLAESAAAQQARHSHVELQEVEVVTGEEDESNVFQVSNMTILYLHKTFCYVIGSHFNRS